MVIFQFIDYRLLDILKDNIEVVIVITFLIGVITGYILVVKKEDDYIKFLKNEVWEYKSREGKHNE